MDSVNLVFELLTIVILYAEISGDEISKGIEGSDYGYGMTRGMFDGWTAVRLKKWHSDVSLDVVLHLFNHMERTADGIWKKVPEQTIELLNKEAIV